jgi:hypothetical protein
MLHKKKGRWTKEHNNFVSNCKIKRYYCESSKSFAGEETKEFDRVYSSSQMILISNASHGAPQPMPRSLSRLGQLEKKLAVRRRAIYPAVHMQGQIDHRFWLHALFLCSQLG